MIYQSVHVFTFVNKRAQAPVINITHNYLFIYTNSISTTTVKPQYLGILCLYNNTFNLKFLTNKSPFLDPMSFKPMWSYCKIHFNDSQDALGIFTTIN